MILNCRLCNSADLKYLYSVGNNNKFDYYRCNNCGLVNLDLEGLDFAEQGAFMDAKITSSCNPVVIIALESLDNCL
jgi:hypothetical protein